MTQLFLQLAKNKVRTKTQVVAVLIASEENSEIAGVGVETLMESGKIDFIKNGPVIWVDCSDSQPCIGTAGAITWSLKATGKLFHSGLPNLGINGLELGMDALVKIQERFYKDFGPLEQEREYNFSCPSTMKPTRIESSTNGLNQIPPWVKISGDVRLSPFYEMKDLISKVQAYVDDLNKDLTVLEGLRGPSSKYTLPSEDLTGKLEFTFDKHYFEGIACSLESVGFKSLEGAITTVLGQAKPFSISGSLPLVRDLQRAGFDLTLIGFGKSAVYHGDNEYCSLTDMKNAIKILAQTIVNVEEAHA
jgi:acetylornithine deacetylase